MSKFTLSIVFLLSVVLITGISVYSAYAGEPGMTPQTQGEVEFVSGGIGADERDAMKRIQGQYNLRLEFSAAGTGEYLSDIQVRIDDRQGRTVLDTVAYGPKLFARVPPGAYTIAAESDGRVLRRSVAVGPRQSVSQEFRFPR